MELGDEMPWSVWASPRTASNAAERFDAVIVGVRAFGMQIAADGMNNAGLTVSAHTFTTSEYQSASPSGKTVVYADLARYLLMRYSTCAEVMHALSNEIRVVAPGILSHQTHLFVHWAVQDATGQSLVVEYEDGSLKLHNNTATGVMTNDPGFEWHRRNTRQYAGMSGVFRAANPVIASDYTSHGWNLVGLPGDLGPPSRFVRTFVLKQLSLQNIPPHTIEDGFALVDKLISAVAIPKGAVGPKSPSEKTFDYTQWSIIKLPRERRIYFKTYSQRTWRLIDLNQLRFDGRRLIRLDQSGQAPFVDECLDVTQALNRAALDSDTTLRSVGLGNGVFRTVDEATGATFPDWPLTDESNSGYLVTS